MDRFEEEEKKQTFCKRGGGGNFLLVAPQTPPLPLKVYKSPIFNLVLLYTFGGGGALQKCTKVPVPVMMKLYTTPPSILHHGHHPAWLGYSSRKVAFGINPHVSWPLVTTILQCIASLVAGG